MSDVGRTLSMFFIWAATAAISILIISSEGVFGGGNAWVIAPVMTAAVIATAMVLFSKAYEARLMSRISGDADREKPKRINAADPDTKMRLLLEMMDEDERYAFKQAMKERMLSGSRDGELNYDADSLGALLDEDDYPHRRRR